MKLFKSIFSLFYILGFISLLIIFSWVIVSFSYYNHKVGGNENIDIEPLYLEKQASFHYKVDGYINIDIECEKKQPDKILVAYALYYLDKYEKEVYLYDFTFPSSLIVVDKSGEATIFSSTQQEHREELLI